MSRKDEFDNQVVWIKYDGFIQHYIFLIWRFQQFNITDPLSKMEIYNIVNVEYLNRQTYIKYH